MEYSTNLIGNTEAMRRIEESSYEGIQSNRKEGGGIAKPYSSPISLRIANAELLHHRSLMEAESDNPRQGKGINTSSCFGVERHKDSAYKISYSEVHSTSKVSDESLNFAILNLPFYKYIVCSKEKKYLLK